MITKRKSKRWAKFKVLLILPLFSFLVLTFADSSTTREPDKVKQKDVDNVLLTQGDAKDSTYTKDQKKAEEEKKKRELAKKKAQEEAKEIEMKIKQLKKEYEATDDLEMRKKIKAKIAALEKKRMKLKESLKVDIYKTSVGIGGGVKGGVEGGVASGVEGGVAGGVQGGVIEGTSVSALMIELEALKKKYEATDDPELKEKIKIKMTKLKKIEHEKQIEMTIKKLEKKYKETDDPELKKKIKQKLTQLRQELKKKKI